MTVYLRNMPYPVIHLGIKHRRISFKRNISPIRHQFRIPYFDFSEIKTKNGNTTPGVVWTKLLDEEVKAVLEE